MLKAGYVTHLASIILVPFKHFHGDILKSLLLVSTYITFPHNSSIFLTSIDLAWIPLECWVGNLRILPSNPLALTMMKIQLVLAFSG